MAATGWLWLSSPAPAGARAGGGHSFSGHSSGSHSSGSHSSSFSHPSSSRSGSSGFSGSRGVPLVGLAGLPCGCSFLLVLILITAVVFAIMALKAKARSQAGPPPTLPQPADLERIRDLDPDFSVVLFEDFVYALYSRAHHARTNAADLAALAPYLSPAVRQNLAARAPVGVPVSAVVVGALRATDLRLPAAVPGQPPDPAARIVAVLEFESNLTTGEPGSEATQYVRERWQLGRAAGARSRTPENVRTFHCPNCGAPFEAAHASDLAGGAGESSDGGRCAYCGEVVSGGRFDWSVEAVELLESEARPPALTGNVEEQGTDDPTIYHPLVQERRAELLRDDPATTDEALLARLQLIYGEVNAAWTALDLTRARPLVSDGLFDYLQYWISAYRHQGLRNVTENMRITRSTLAKVVRDRFFDAVTFRIYGAGRDSTIEQVTGKLVGGDPQNDRIYSEYWTLIRGAAVRGAPRAEKSCPNCGAPLETGMAGECKHCGAKVTSGDFDWVLSKIEQDDSYTG